MLIPARNVVALRKAQERPSQVWHRFYGLAERYRAGLLQAEDLTPEDRAALTVWMIEHPRKEGRMGSGESGRAQPGGC